MISQLRQRLAYEFPEVVKHKFTISSVHGFTPMIGWLAGCHSTVRLENKYRASVAPSLGITISNYTKAHASLIMAIETRITANLDRFREVLEYPQFAPYFEVFDRFGFGLDNKILLLYHCYPFDKFLVNGIAWIERVARDNDKLQKRDRSLRKFQAYMGMSYKYHKSWRQH